MTHRNGVLFIGPENCKILGGYIENLSLPQKMIKMLQTELSLFNKFYLFKFN